jgi:hypothetical protein
MKPVCGGSIECGSSQVFTLATVKGNRSVAGNGNGVTCLNASIMQNACKQDVSGPLPIQGC